MGKKKKIVNLLAFNKKRNRAFLKVITNLIIQLHWAVLVSIANFLISGSWLQLTFSIILFILITYIATYLEEINGNT